MCTVAVAVAADRRWPLVMAANRDERLGRASESWALRELPGGVRAASPRDLEAGGTWVGVADSGLLVAITNYHAPDRTGPDRSLRSRGELVSAALSSRRLAAARERARATEAARYNPFHLLVLEGAGGFLWRFDGARAEIEDLGPGLHLVTERDPHGRCPRGEWVRGRWPLDASPGRLRQLLSAHGEPQGDLPCIHLGEAYGTRSSFVLRMARALEHSELYVADGPPCVTPMEDRSRLLAELGGRSA
jgi:uncharacterized protein with NRDE domain